MKRGGLFILLILGFKMSNAQKAVVANDELKILYRNYENKIAINKNGYDCSQLKLFAKPSSGSNEDSIDISGEGCHYKIKTNIWGWVDLIVQASKGDTNLVYDTVTFFVKNIPPPTPTLGGRLRGGKALGGVIKAMSGVIAVSNTDLPFRSEVLSFEFHYRNSDQKKNKDLTANGPIFTHEMQMTLNNISEGDSIIIDHIMVKYANVPSEDIGKIEFSILGN